MLITEIGLVCISTGKESVQTLPRAMPYAEAVDHCTKEFKDYRAWLCVPPTLKNKHVMIHYDYYIICLSLLEARSMVSLHAGKEVPNYIKQALRMKGLINHDNHPTPSGVYVSKSLNTHTFI